MRLSLQLLFVVACVVGYSYSAKLDPNSSGKHGLKSWDEEETKHKVICEECEFAQYKELSEQETDKIKLVKMKSCLAAKKRQIGKEEEEKRKRAARSADENDTSKDTTSFEDIFKSSAAFKRVLKQFLKLKQIVSQKTEKLEQEIAKAVDQFKSEHTEDDDEEETDLDKPILAGCDNKLKCDKPKHVIRVKEAVLTSRDQDNVCASSTQLLQLNLDALNETCYDKEEATKRLSNICNGQSECEVSVTLFFGSLCACTEKKHLEVEYVCEPESSSSSSSSLTGSHSVSKRALYYQNSRQEEQEFNSFRNNILDYYDYYGDEYYYGDYYYGDYYYGDYYYGDYYDYLGDYYYGDYYYGDYYDYYGDYYYGDYYDYYGDYYYGDYYYGDYYYGDYYNGGRGFPRMLSASQKSTPVVKQAPNSVSSDISAKNSLESITKLAGYEAIPLANGEFMKKRKTSVGKDQRHRKNKNTRDDKKRRRVNRKDKKREKRPCKKPFKPNGNKPNGNKPNGNKPNGNKPNGNKPNGNNPNGNKPNGNKPNGNKPNGNNPLHPTL